ncbi:hypothetical protein PF004_g32230 [Phytophthora fragariae]|uniref:Uncharacterized protein n=1 Tax=Phytophthora fragariae TaxID=53985 RepID=A0A6G0M6T7_9STRA|nr:hypothetical protein PF004_g32230 [Phytophthora fragariae]
MLVMVSAVADDKLRLPTSKVRGSVSGSVVEASDGRPRSLMTSCGCPPASVPKLVMASALAHDKLRLPTSKQYPAAWSKLVMGVRARS